MKREFTSAELETYIDEELPADEMAAIESEVRTNAELRAAIAEILERQNAGIALDRLDLAAPSTSCLTRGQLGSYLLGALSADEFAEIVAFHVRDGGAAAAAGGEAVEDLQRLEAERRRARGCQQQGRRRGRSGRAGPSPTLLRIERGVPLRQRRRPDRRQRTAGTRASDPPLIAERRKPPGSRTSSGAA
jgi:anti-sigma factor RsiW